MVSKKRNDHGPPKIRDLHLIGTVPGGAQRFEDVLRLRTRGQLGAKRGPKLDAKVRKILIFGAPKWRYPFLGIPYLN